MGAIQRYWEPYLAGVSNVRIEYKPYTNWAGQVNVPNLQVPDPRGSFFRLNCGYLWDTLAIGAGGEVGMCCYDMNAEHGLGNAVDRPLQDLWHSEALNALRRQHARGALDSLPLCAACRMGRKYPSDYLWRRWR